MAAPADDWMLAWQPMVDAIGREFDADAPLVWGERIDASMVARYIEPLELDCRLHSDIAVARANGHERLVVPDTALFSLSLPLVWRPGDAPIFQSDERDAQPVTGVIGGRLCGLEPPTTGAFAVQWDTDFIKPALVGDRLCRRGLLLVACKPREMRMGRGAFITWQSEVINEQFEILARIRSTLFRYVPAIAGGA